MFKKDDVVFDQVFGKGVVLEVSFRDDLAVPVFAKVKFDNLVDKSSKSDKPERYIAWRAFYALKMYSEDMEELDFSKTLIRYGFNLNKRNHLESYSRDQLVIRKIYSEKGSVHWIVFEDLEFKPTLENLKKLIDFNNSIEAFLNPK